ncbi:MAG: 1,4-dihydroxy-2-naphthoate polyprenyltransferase [Ignavibacteriales bacterium]|nr:1,4-dihydroxy-2-naphthoate polyprenyltransferase [Ignavibacteriales bacterium]
MAKAKKISKLKCWFLAARPKTLPAAFVPVIVGSALAIREYSFKPIAAFVALFCCLLLQIGANFSNDLFDYLKGSDKKDRVGPIRVMASGLISVKEMKIGLLVVYGVCFFLGLYLVHLGGWIILIIGVLSIFMSLAYTTGPFPLAYNGLGDIFVFLFFGLIGTIGTYYVQTLQITALSVLCAIPVGALITNILVVNNYRDIEEDKIANKKTLAVIFGKIFSRIEYVFMLLVSYSVLIPIYFSIKNIFVLLPVVIFPFSIILIKMLFTLSGKQLNKTLTLSAMFSALFGILLSIGIIVS